MLQALHHIDVSHGTVVALGNFDGVHLGHQTLLRQTADIAARLGCPSVAYTFHPHPLIALGQELPLITAEPEKERLIARLGIDYVFRADFAQIRSLSPPEFVQDILLKQLHIKAAVMGVTHHFGKNGSGSAEDMQAFGQQLGFDTVLVCPVYAEGQMASSSNIRELVAAGDVKRAATLLGRPFSLSGTVRLGNRIGRTIDFPTANLLPQAGLLLPKNGVYMSNLTVDGITYKGITNVGVNPTVGNGHVTVETNILDFDRDIYDKHIHVAFLDRIRGERKFADLSALKAQLQADREKRKKY